MRIAVKVIPDARLFSVQLTATGLKCRLPEKAEKGRANRYLLKKLSEVLRTSVILISGEISPRKIIEVAIDADELKRRIEAYNEG